MDRSDPHSPVMDPHFPEGPRSAIGWFWAFRRYLGRYYQASDRSKCDPSPWPDGFDPQRNPVFAHNEIDIEAPATDVFGVLIDAQAWHTFYPNASGVVMAAGSAGRLAAGSRFEWTTFGTRQRSRVTVFEPSVALGWTADSPGTHAFHRWILDHRGGSTRVITEECQHGPVAFLDRYWMNRSLHAAHQLWLERLRGQLL